MIEGANIHIFVLTDCKNNRFHAKEAERTVYEYPPPPQLYTVLAATVQTTP